MSAALAHSVLTLILVSWLQLAPEIDLSNPPVTTTRESVHRAGRFTRSLAMSAAFVGGVATAAATGGAIGLILGGSNWAGIVGALVGLGVGAGVAALLSPLLIWGIGRALGGQGSLGATAVGVLLGLSVFAAAFMSWALLGPTYTPGTAVALGLCVPAVIAGGAWAFEISDAIVVAPTPTGVVMAF